jgi:hypothetical protein
MTLIRNNLRPYASSIPAQPALRGVATMAALNPEVAAWLEGRSSIDLAPVQASAPRELAQGLRARLLPVAQDPAAFKNLLSTSFGDAYDSEKAEGIRQKVLRGDMSWLPKVKYVDDASLPSGCGAYDKASGTVYLSERLRGQPTAAVEVFSEEVGHHLDAQLNTKDSPGDEGEIFRRTLSGESLSARRLAEIRSEDDRGVVRIDGREVEVEYFFGKVFKKIGGAIKKGIQKVGGAVAKVAKGVGSAVKKVGGVVKKVGQGLQRGLGAISKVLSPIRKVLDALGPALALVPGVGQILMGVRTGLGALSAAASGKWSGVLQTVAAAFGGKFGALITKGIEMFKTAKGAYEKGRTVLERLAG